MIKEMLENPRYEEKIKTINTKIVYITHKIEKSYLMLERQLTENLEIEQIRRELKGIEDELNELDELIMNILALFEPETKDLRILISYLKITDEFSKLAKTAKEYSNISYEIKEYFKDAKNIIDYLILLHKSINNSLKYSTQLLNHDNRNDLVSIVRKIKIEDNKIKDIDSLIDAEILEVIKCSFSNRVISFVSGIKKLEQISYSAIRIANLIHYAKEGERLKNYEEGT